MLIISALFVNIVRLVGVLLLFGRCRACWWGAGMGWRGGGGEGHTHLGGA